MKPTVNKLLLGSLVFLFLLLTACGNGGNTVKESGSAAQSAAPSANGASAGEEASAADEAPGMRSYTDAAGVTQQIPANPQRVVTTQFLDAMLVLGVKPIGAGSWVMDANYLKGKIDGVTKLGNPVNVEKVLELNPDLIVVTDGEEPEVLEQYRKIAPTVVVPFGGGDVYQQVRDVAAVLNKQDAAEQWINDLEARGTEIKENIKGHFKPDDVFTIYWVYGKDMLRIYGGRNLGHVFYRMLDLNPPEFIREKMEQDANFVAEDISMEKLPEYAGDYIIMCVFDEESRKGMFKQLQESSLWKNLPAVKAGHVFYVDADPWFTYSPLAVEQQLDQAENVLLGRQP